MEVAASFRGHVEQIPGRIDQAVVAIFLPGLGRLEKLRAPEVMGLVAGALEHIQDQHVPFFLWANP